MKTKDIAGSAGAAASRAQRSDVAHAEVARRGAAAQQPNAATARGASQDWRAVLAGASPREVLARLVNADVFELRARVARALAERCYLLDGDFVYLRSVARIARFATRYRGEPSLDVWLTEQVDAALLDALERADARDAEDARAIQDARGSEVVVREGAQGAAGRRGAQGPLSSPTCAVQPKAQTQVAPTFVDLARPLGLDPDRMRDVCSAFNRCAPLERAAFFALVLECGELESVAARLGVAPAECARAARQALERCMERATASPAQDAVSHPSKGAAAQLSPSATPEADEGAARTGERDSARESGPDRGRDLGRVLDQSAPGRPSRSTSAATTAERRGAARGQAVAGASSQPAAPQSAPQSARAAAVQRIGQRTELTARPEVAPDSIRSAVELDGARACAPHVRGAERRSNPRGEQGEAR